jgi:hypothetical protein
MKFYNWDPANNELLKRERQISFEEVIFHIQNGDEVDIFNHPNLPWRAPSGCGTSSPFWGPLRSVRLKT